MKYLRELTVEEHKKIALDILKDVAQFCDKHGLKYYLAYGTLLGAVRHKGFIPWDDDIDIQMPREDYERFMECFNRENTKKELKAISPRDCIAKHTFLKVIRIDTVKIERGIVYQKNGLLGVDIDIFPLDGQPDSEKVFKKYYKKKMRYYTALSKIEMPVGMVRKHKRMAARVYQFVITSIMKIDRAKILNAIDKINARYPYEKSIYAGSTASLSNSIKNRYLRRYYDTGILLDFESYPFCAPRGYHEILTQMYGNYMELPPEAERKTHHFNQVYIKGE